MMVKACACSSDASPAGMPRPIAQNKKGKLAKANGQAIAQQQAQRNGRPGDKQQRREGDQHKAQAASISGGILCNPSLITTKLSPHTTTTSSASDPSFLVIPCLCRY